MAEPGMLGPASAGEGLHLYCLARRADLPHVGGPGLEPGSPVRVVHDGELAAVVSDVQLSAFTGAQGEANLADVAWLGPRACRHQEVVERVRRHGPVLPIRFGTLYGSHGAMWSLLDTRRHEIVVFLDGMEDLEEWGVKAVCAGAGHPGPPADPPEGEAGAPGVGLGYLRRRRDEHALRAQGEAELARLREEITTALDEAVRSSAGLRTASVEADDGEVAVLNRALLVRRGDVEDLREKVGRLEDRHRGHSLRLRLSGPWAPYSFCPDLGAEPVEATR